MNLDGGVTVDAFRFGAVPNISMYFLTHFHSDHYGGLSKNWTHGKIYCSEITGDLIIQELKVDPMYVVKLPMNEPIDFGKFTVSLIDANHCPGSVLFLFESPLTKILHTGDFRAVPAHVTHPLVYKKRIDTLYLDTTYLNPKYTFPQQSDVVNACAELCFKIQRDPQLVSRMVAGGGASSKPGLISSMLSLAKPVVAAAQARDSAGRLLVIVGTYSIGKERMAMAIARKLKTKIYAQPNKRRIFACLNDPELNDLLTDNPNDGQVHVVSLQEIRPDTLNSYLDQFTSHFARIIGFRPTGWTFTPSKVRKQTTDLASVPLDTIIRDWLPPYTSAPPHMIPGRGSTDRVSHFSVPYSEHSSFRELACFCTALDVGRVIPTVNVGSPKTRELMKHWLDRWAMARKKAGGKLAHADERVRW
ncbi:DNA repair metallo-beta-lactamase-domain-containing protein [Limtongia smithiae]|uniref:DNA repair metallo-beta-lactamase-domain-containing protein n=1 Tax=Limtongia smithiae TaxID=1125753 RepID=UPI0034CEC116